jgi:hypothetical protein
MKKFFILLSILIISSCNITITRGSDKEAEEAPNPVIESSEESNKYFITLLGKIISDCIEQGKDMGIPSGGVFKCYPDGAKEGYIHIKRTGENTFSAYTDRFVLSPEICNSNEELVKLAIPKLQGSFHIDEKMGEVKFDAYFEKIYSSIIGKEYKYGKLSAAFNEDKESLDLYYDIEGKNASYNGSPEEFMSKLCGTPIQEKEENRLYLAVMETVAAMNCMDSADAAGLMPGQTTECLNEDGNTLCMGGSARVSIMEDGNFEINFIDCKTVDPFCNMKDSFYAHGLVRIFPGANNIYIKNVKTSFMGLVEGHQNGSFTVSFGDIVVIQGEFDKVSFAYKMHEDDVIKKTCSLF